MSTLDLTRVPDSVEDVHRKRPSLHRQNPTRVLAGVSGFIQVEEIMKFLLIMIISELLS